MRCRYCNQRLNLFKSLSGSSFCSQEHHKLYEEAEANKGFERLLQFVEKDSKSRTAKTVPPVSPFSKTDSPAAKPSAPIAPVPETIAAKVEKPPEAAVDGPMAGFLFQPINPVLDTSAEAPANFEIIEGSFTPDPPALPAFQFAIAATDLQKLADGEPPPLATWTDPLVSVLDAVAASIQVHSVGSVRARSSALALPSPDHQPIEPKGHTFLFVSDGSALQPSIQAVFDTRGFAKLARLNPLQREIPAASESTGWLPARSGAPALSRPAALPAVDSKALSQAKTSGEASVSMSGAVNRTGVGNNVSAPPTRAPQLLVGLGLSAAPRTIRANVGQTLSPGQHTVRAARLEQENSRAPAMHWSPAQPAVTGLRQPAFQAVRVDQCDRATAMGMQGAMTRAGIARAVRQPSTQSAHLVNTLGSIDIPNRVPAAVQNMSGSLDCASSPAIVVQEGCIVPRVQSTVAGLGSGLRSVTVPRNLAVRETDTALAVGITEAKKPDNISSPLFVPGAAIYRRLLTIGINRTARKILSRAQASDVPPRSVISSPRQALRDCLMPAILRSTETRLGSAIASADWFHESDSLVRALAAGAPIPRLFSIRFEPEWPAVLCSTESRLGSAIASADWFHESDSSVQAFPSSKPTPRLFSVRFEPELSMNDVPTLRVDQAVRRLALEVHDWSFVGSEWKSQKLASSQPSRTSPLSLVSKPRPPVTRLAPRSIPGLNRYTAIVNVNARRGDAWGATVSASADEHQPQFALPEVTSELFSTLRLSPQVALKSPSMAPVDQKNTGAGSRPQPSPLRVQAASMLVRPGSRVAAGGIRWRASRVWATVASPSLPDPGIVQMTPSGRETSVSSLRSLQDALRIDSGAVRESATMRVNPTPPAIGSDLDAQTSPPRIPLANALPRRRGPKLPGINSAIGDLSVLIVASR